MISVPSLTAVLAVIGAGLAVTAVLTGLGGALLVRRPATPRALVLRPPVPAQRRPPRPAPARAR